LFFDIFLTVLDFTDKKSLGFSLVWHEVDYFRQLVRYDNTENESVNKINFYEHNDYLLPD
jgi:hypothetical protein